MTHWMLFGLTFAPPVVVVAMSAWRERKVLAGGDDPRPTEGPAWKAGAFYVNPRDPALFAPRRHGVVALNFGNPLTWLTLVLLLGQPLLLTVLTASFGARR